MELASKPNPIDQRTEKTKIINRLRRLEGQLRGLQRMVEEDQSCADILTQLASAKSALNSTGDAMLETYLTLCQIEGNHAPNDLIRLVKLIR